VPLLGTSNGASKCCHVGTRVALEQADEQVEGIRLDERLIALEVDERSPSSCRATSAMRSVPEG
jgi:hypothetical protein